MKRLVLGWSGVLLLLAAAILGGKAAYQAMQPAATSIPVPVPVYEIEAISGDHKASLLNLNLGQPGVPQAPIPVDVDGDLLPDVTVAVNLLDVEGGLPLPIVLTDAIAPNVQIDRLVTAPVLGQKSPPLRINIKLTLVDATGQKGPTVIRFGYDTGLGGSIPTSFKAVLGGLDQFFNPLKAVIDTSAGYLGIDPSLEDLGLAPVAGAYRGPLRVIGGLDSDALDAKLDLGFDPMPQAMQVDYAHDTQQHIDVAHSTQAEVDLDGIINLDKGGTKTDVNARVERLPKKFGVDIATGTPGQGEIHYAASSDGRLPDVDLDMERSKPNEKPLSVNTKVTALPPALDVVWQNPEDGPLHVDFNAGGAGVGAVEASIATWDTDEPTPAVIGKWEPTEDQYLSVQTGPDGFEGPSLIRARLERVRSAIIDQVDQGPFDATLDIGDGASPLETHVDADFRSSKDGPKVKIDGTVAPLPEQMTLHYQPTPDADATQPLVITYDAARSTDIDATVDIVLPDAADDAICGQPNTICGTIAARNVSTHLGATVERPSEHETKVNLVTEPDLAIQPDLDVDLTLGGKPDKKPTYITGSILGLPETADVRILEADDGEFQRLDLVAQDEVGSIDVRVRNFGQRPDDLPAPGAVQAQPTWVSAVMREQLYEVGGRIEHLRHAHFLTLDDIMGGTISLGDGADLGVHVDILGRKDDNNLVVDTFADATISPFPKDIAFCLGQAGRAVDANVPPTDDLLTAQCESDNPYGDGSVSTSPIELHYDTDVAFDVKGSFTSTKHNSNPGPSDDVVTAATFDLHDVPDNITAAITALDKGAGVPLRVLTNAPGAPDTNGHLTLERTTGTASCTQASPSGGTATCADVTIDSLPPFASVLAQLPEEEGDELKIAFHGCAFDFFGTETCTQGSATDQIGSLAAKVRFDRGNPDPLPVLDGPDNPATPHATVALDRNSDNDMGVDADVYVEGIRHLDLVTSDAGTTAHTDIGDGTKPLVADIDADMRDGSADKRRYVVDATVTPLPPVLNFDYDAPGDNEFDQLTHVHLDSSQTADVTGRIEMYNHGAGPGCGDNGTLCADLDLKRLPQDTNLDLRTVLTGPLTQRHRTLTVDIDAIPHPDVAKPDLDVDATIGPLTLGADQETPLVIDALLEGIPQRTEVRMTDTEKSVDEFTIDPDDQVQGPPGKARTLDSVDVHTCDWNVGTQACDAAIGQLDTLAASIRTFLFRPADFPPPPAVPANEMAASVTTRGDLAEATVNVTNLSEVRFVTDQDGSEGSKGSLMGARLQAGTGQPLTVHADLGGLRPGELSFGDHDYSDALLDVLADARFSNLPPKLTFCMRAAGIEGGDGSGTDMTGTCEQDHPFQFGEPDESPLSIAYDAHGTTIEQIDTTAVVRIADTDNAPDPTHIDGELHVTKMPSTLEVHVKTPEVIDEDLGTSTPLLIRFQTSDSPGLSVSARAHLTVGDSVCEDPRDDKEAICASASLTDLPETLDLYFDPSKGAQQFELAQSDPNADTKVDITELSFSQVRPKPVDDRRPAIVVSGSITDLPSTLSGFFLEPPHENETPDISLVAGEPITEVALNYRNYVGVDPHPETAPTQRPDVGINPDEHAFVWQRNKDTKADILVRSLQKIGVRQQRTGTGAALDTVVLTAGFGENKNLRAYADLAPGAGDGMDDGGLTNKHLIADVTIENLAANLTVCFRPDHTTDATPAGQPTWCDDPTIPNQLKPEFSGTLAIEGEHDGGVDLVNIDAFVRLTGPDSEHLAAVADLDGIPEKVHAFLPAPKTGLSTEVFDIATYNSANAPTAVGRIKARAASFDLAGVYSADEAPYPERVRDDEPFGTIPDFGADQHLALVKVDDDFEVSALLGALGDAPASRLQHLRLAPNPCPVPDDTPPADYPFFPDYPGDVSQYQCVRVDFDSADDDPLGIYLVTQKGEKRVTFENGGLTDIPSYLQLTLTDDDLYRDDPDTAENDYIFRDWCKPASEYEPNATPDCVAPLLRFDQPSNSVLHGDIRVLDDVDDETALEALAPSDTEFLPDLNATPGAEGGGWSSQWGDDPHGIRFKVLRYDPARADDDNDGIKNEDEDDYVEGKPERLALDAHIRLDLPQSLTVDQPQGWHRKVFTPATTGRPAGEFDASDFRVRIAVRNAAGQAVDTLGRAAGVAILGDGSEVMTGGVGTPGEEDNGVEGFLLPSEFGIAFYKRHNASVLEDGFIQIDGRVNIPISMGIRLNKEITKNKFNVGLRADILNVPEFEPGDKTADPSFRLVAETVKLGPEGQHYVEGRNCGIVSCTFAIINANVDMEFDFKADPDNPARRVEVFFRQGTFNSNHKWYRKARNGLEIWGFNTIEPTDANDPEQRAPIDAVVHVSIDPFDVYHHRGVYLLGSLTIDLQSRVETTLVLDNVEHFWFKQNLLHMEMHSEGPPGGQAFIPGVNMAIKHFSIEVWFILIPVVNMRYIDFDNNVATMWQQCKKSDVFANMVAFNNGDGANQVLWPFANPGQYAKALLGKVVPILSPFFCLSSVDGLKTERPMPNLAVPLPGHPVPGTEEDTTDYLDETDDQEDPAADPPDVPIDQNTTMCGVLTAGKLTVAAELSGTACPEDEPLTIVADSIEVLDGGSIVSRANASPGNSSSGWGGSHGADGGSSPKGDSFDSAFGNETSFSDTENGHRGGGSDLGGDAGGRLILQAEKITVAAGGRIDVAGLDGQQAPPVECDSDTVDAGGGGAGGGLIIVARSVVNNDGVITAAGGNGANGSKGGGGGGGGRVKLQVPNWSGPHVDVSGGQGGTGSCEDSGGGTGGDYDLLANWEQAWSSPMPLGSGWSNGESLQVPYRADVDFDDGDTSYTTYLCYTHVSLDALGDDANDEKGLSDLFIDQMPSPGSITPDDPCGSAPLYASATSTDEEVPYDPTADPPVVSYLTPLSDEPLPEGYVGFWTTVVMSGDVVHSLPSGPQLITGIDNTEPVVEITSAKVSGLEGQGDNVELEFDASDEGGSGLAGVRCSNNDDKWKPCASGNLWRLKGGGGNQTIVVEACDSAGNCAQDTFDLTLDTIAPPEVHLTYSSPDGANNWYLTPPTFSLFYEGEVAAANPAFRWAVDGESEKSCAVGDPCIVASDALDHLLSGEHTFGFTGVDERGYRWGRTHFMNPDNGLTKTFMLDMVPPKVGYEIVPGAPNGQNSWYTTKPFLVIGTIDDEGGSGVDPGRVEYKFGGVEWLPYTIGQPVTVPLGVSSVCVRAYDIAGNVTEPDCQSVSVDDVMPEASASVDGAPGPTGWFTSVPTISFTMSDDTSGVPSDQNRFRYRVDNGPYITCDAGCEVDPSLMSSVGHHEVHWSAIDEAGNRPLEKATSVVFQLDTAVPTTRFSLAPIGPEGSDGWHLREPEVRLFAEDQPFGSGVESTSYTVDNGLITGYGGPIHLSAGPHQVCAFSKDVAGNTEEATCIDVNVDMDDPSAEVVVNPLPQGLADWHLDVTFTNGTGADPQPGSGVDGVFISVDGRPFVPVPVAGNLAIGEGVHDVRVFSIDVAGRPSPVAQQTIHVDRSLPVSRARVFGFMPAANGWHRAKPVVVLSAVDGDENSGIALLEYKLGAADWTPYAGPIEVPEGVIEIQHRSTDKAGRMGPAIRLPLRADLTPAVVKATSADPSVWLKIGQLLGPANAQLRWEVTENLAEKVHAYVVIHDLTGNVVRLLDAGSHDVTPGVVYQGSTAWDGKDQTLLGLVPLGVYYYRVAVVDEAGNWSHSGESAPLTIKLKVCVPIILPC